MRPFQGHGHRRCAKEPGMLESLPPLSALAIAALGLFAGGLVKGVVGIGLPLIAVPVIAMVFPVPIAVSVLALPILGSNLLQTRQGEGPLPALKRFWIMILCLVGGILVGAQMLVSLDEQRLGMVLGSLLLGVVALQLLPIRLEVPAKREGPVGGHLDPDGQGGADSDPACGRSRLAARARYFPDAPG